MLQPKTKEDSMKPPLMLDESVDTNNLNENQSLFPKLDALVLYLPTYVVHGRPKALNVLVLSFLLLYVLQSIIASIYQGYAVGKSTESKTASIVVIMVFSILPSFVRLTRIKFFYQHFTFKLWQNTEHEDNDSYLLHHITTSQQSRFVRNFRRIFFTAVILTFIVYGSSVYFALYQLFTQHYLADNFLLDLHGYCAMALEFFFLASDLVLTAICFLHFSESAFHSKSYAAKLSEHLVRNTVLEYTHMFDDYYLLFNKIQRYNELFSSWITLFFNLSTLQVWYSVNMFKWYAAHDFDFQFSRAYQLKWCIIYSVVSVYTTLLLLWMLWPTFAVAKQSETMRTEVSNYIHRLVQSKILKNDGSAAVYKEHRKSVVVHLTTSVQAMEQKEMDHAEVVSVLNVLNRLLFVMDDDRCYFYLLGKEINRKNATVAVVLLLFGRILTLLFVF